MPSAWEKIDLEGSGLQSANLRLVRRLKKRVTAYMLWVLFPVGAHRIYLADWPRALVYVALSSAAVGLHLSAARWFALVPAAIAGACALYDLIWIDRRVTWLNKQARMGEYLRAGSAPPPGFRGRYTDDAGLDEYIRTKEAETGGHVQPVLSAKTPNRAPSFAEQEKMLRELAKRK